MTARPPRARGGHGEPSAGAPAGEASSGDPGDDDPAVGPLTALPAIGEAVRELPDRWRELGEFIREQRGVARLSLRRLSQLAGISNPYLSQIERGMRHPSAEILQQIAKGLRISAETLYVRAGILDERPAAGDLIDAVVSDPTLTDEQKRTLVHIVTTFRAENHPDGAHPAPAAAAAPARRKPGSAR